MGRTQREYDGDGGGMRCDETDSQSISTRYRIRTGHISDECTLYLYALLAASDGDDSSGRTLTRFHVLCSIVGRVFAYFLHCIIFYGKQRAKIDSSAAASE